MNLKIYIKDSEIIITNVTRYEVTEDTTPIKKTNSRKKKTEEEKSKDESDSIEQISIEFPQDDIVPAEDLTEVSENNVFNNSDNVSDVFKPDTSKTFWYPDVDNVWEYEWPLYGCCPLRRRKISDLPENEMVKVDDI